MTVLEETRDSIRAAADRVGPAVVGLGRGWGRGSGVVIREGLVLVGAHGLRSDEPTINFADGRRATGTVEGVDPNLNLAAVSVDTAGVEPVEWAGDGVGVGDPVIALSNPGGRGLRVTLGFVSAADRRFRGPRGRRIAGGIEHTAPLPRGSSGAPLVDTGGGLVGINAVRLQEGFVLAAPADAALRDRVELLSRGEAPSQPRLGIVVAPPRVARRMRRAVGLPEREGLLVRGVQEGSPADRAGIERGDLIVAAAGRDVGGLDDLYAALDAASTGGSLELGLVRGSEETAVTVSFSEPEVKA
jgi:S1-C subfamily serine protease